MNALPLYQDVKSKVNGVIDYSIGKKGLEINYVFNGVETIIIKNPEEICKLLKNSRLINDWCNEGDIIIEMVTELNEVDHHGEHVQKEFVQYLSWDEFVFGFDLSKHEAITIATDHEFSKAMQEWFDAELNKARDKYKLNPQHAHINNGFLS